jgi:DNA-binding transcriptional MocR family regulator
MTIYTSEGEEFSDQYEYQRSMAHRMPLGSPQELTDALKINSGTTLPAVSESSSTGFLEARNDKIPELGDMPDEHYNDTWIGSFARRGRTDQEILKDIPDDEELFSFGGKSDLISRHKRKPQPKPALTSNSGEYQVAEIKPLPLLTPAKLQTLLDRADSDTSLKRLKGRLERQGVNTDAIPQLRDIK